MFVCLTVFLSFPFNYPVNNCSIFEDTPNLCYYLIYIKFFAKIVRNCPCCSRNHLHGVVDCNDFGKIL